MDQQESIDEKKDRIRQIEITTDIDQLCQLIDQSTFGQIPKSSTGRSSSLSVRFRSVPSSQVKTFRSSRLKRLQASPTKCDDNNDDDDETSCRNLVPFTASSSSSSSSSSHRTLSMRFALSSSSSTSLLNRFRSLSTCHFHPTRRQYHLSNPLRTITLFRTNSSLPSVIEEESNSETTTTTTTSTNTNDSSQLSCTIVDTRRPTGNACNVEELAAYLDNFLYLPKSLSGAAELMYT